MTNPTPPIFTLLLLLIIIIATTPASATPSILHRGFQATPDPSPSTTFQPLLADPTGNFTLCFLRVQTHLLSLAVVHLPSHEPLWTAALTRPVQWDKLTRLTFNGSLVISDPQSRVLWSTQTDTGNDVVLSPSSNLQVLSHSNSNSPLWQSFDFPSDTIVEAQNFTSSMALTSSNGLYTLRLGADFFGLYAKFNANKDQIYYKHTALQVKAAIVKGEGPIYIRVSPDGYLGMYQTGTQPADVQPFNSYQRSVPGTRRLRIEPDGNLKSYYWSGSQWVVDYTAIAETCELPDPCGPYGVCKAASGCSCLDNGTDVGPGKCYSGRESGGFCGEEKFRVLRRVGVELPYKELMGFVETASLEGCEMECESNCTCWGAVYSNSSGYCYMMDYPVQSLLAVGDGGKAGYFKVPEGPGGRKPSAGLRVGIGFLIGAVVLVAATVGFVLWRRRVGARTYLQQERMVDPGPYKDLGSESFGSVELGRR